MNFIRNRKFRAGPQASLEGFICPQNSDKQQKNQGFRTVSRRGGTGGAKNTSLAKEGRGGLKNLTGWIEDCMTTQESLRRDVGKITSPCSKVYIGT